MDSIKIVKIDNLIIIGVLTTGHQLLNPRVVEATPVGNGNMAIKFLQFFGAPKVIDFDPAKYSLMYEPTDEGMITAYREAVTGLTLAKKMPDNVVALGVKSIQ